MSYECLTLEMKESVAVLTLNTPDQLNALTGGMQSELIEAATEIAASDARAVVLGGAGRAFCAGVSIHEFAEIAASDDDAERYEAFALGRKLADTLEAIPQVTVAALHGFVVGGGVVLASVCDMRIAASDTTFSIPEIDLGITLGWGGIKRFLREVSPPLAREFVMTGRRFTAHEALAAGFVNKVVPPEDVDAVALDLARTIAAKPHAAIRTTKQHFAEILDGDDTRDDALTASQSLRDPESAAAAAHYIAQLSGRS
ncbi:MAG: enoyl-CoA hydratase/isomerase family protein [Actinomycetota bacterium]